MIQRVQSLYLLMAALICMGLFFVSYTVDNEGGMLLASANPVLLTLGVLSILLSVTAVFLYKKRRLQLVLGRLNILLNFGTLGVFVYNLLTTSGEADTALEKGVWGLIPIISIVFIVLANKAIIRDEQLVKSVDRLR